LEVSRLIGLKRQAQRAGWDQWIRSAADEHAVLQGCYFSKALGELPIEYIETHCRQSKGEWGGKPVILMPWQRNDLIMPLYGWQRPGNIRRFRTAYVEIAKKNGKSTIASALACYGLGGEDEPGAEIYCAATTKDQAGIVFKEAANMVRQSPDLLKQFGKPIDHTKTIAKDGSSWIRALAAEGASAEGLNIYYLIVDELHAWKDRVFWNALQFGMSARREPITLIVTTAGDNKETICYDFHEYAKRINKAEFFDMSFLGIIYGNEELEEIDGVMTPIDLQDPKYWRRANPGLGIVLTEETFAEQLNKAEKTQSDISSFKRYRFNIWVGAESPWIPMKEWGECAAEIFNEDDFKGQKCFAGLDLASTVDVAACVYAFPKWIAGKLHIYLLPRFWCPEDKVKEITEKSIANYADWVAAGYMTATPGPKIDYTFVMDNINQDRKKFDVKQIAYDRYGATQMMTMLQDSGAKVLEFPQNIVSISPHAKEFMDLILSKRVHHTNNPVMNWMAGNVQVIEDANQNIKPIKPTGKTGRNKKIDGIIGGIMAIAQAITVKSHKSNYSKDKAVT
jgi:phage terminase large subunit-like protein